MLNEPRAVCTSASMGRKDQGVTSNSEHREEAVSVWMCVVCLVREGAGNPVSLSPFSSRFGVAVQVTANS